MKAETVQRQATPRPPSSAETMRGGGGAGLRRELQTMTYDAAVQRLAPDETGPGGPKGRKPSTRGRGDEEFDTLLEAVASKKSTVDKPFLDALEVAAATLTPAQKPKLVEVFEAQSDAATKKAIFAAMGMPIGAQTGGAGAKEPIADARTETSAAELDALFRTFVTLPDAHRRAGPERAMKEFVPLDGANDRNSHFEPETKRVRVRSLEDEQVRLAEERLLIEARIKDPKAVLTPEMRAQAKAETPTSETKERAKANYARVFLHEIGHSLDNRDHRDGSFFQGCGWIPVGITQLLAGDPWRGAKPPAPQKGQPSPSERVEKWKTLFTRYATEDAAKPHPGIACQDTIATTEDAAKQNPNAGPALAWFKETRLCKIFVEKQDDYALREVLAEGPVALLENPAGNGFRFVAMNPTAVASCQRMGYQSGVSEREFAAECYAEWFGTEPRGTSGAAQALPEPAKKWLKGLDTGS